MRYATIFTCKSDHILICGQLYLGNLLSKAAMEERCQNKGREKEVLDNGGGSGVSSSGASNIVISKDGEPLPSIVLVNQQFSTA
jgi:hypothetical protein